MKRIKDNRKDERFPRVLAEPALTIIVLPIWLPISVAWSMNQTFFEAIRGLFSAENFKFFCIKPVKGTIMVPYYLVKDRMATVFSLVTKALLWCKLLKKESKCKQTKNLYFFDEILAKYRKHFDSEDRIINDFKNAFEGFSKTSRIMLITRQDVSMVISWLKSKNLYQFIDNVSNSAIK